MTFRKGVSGFFNSFKREKVSDPRHWLTTLIARTAASSGANVTPDSSLRVTAVYACVKVISEAIASLPLMLYKRVGDGKEPATKHYLFSMMHDAPNGFMTSFEWREVLLAYQLLRGNSYNLKVESGSGKILEIIPLNPARMEVGVKEGKPTYTYTHEDGNKEEYPAEKIWHVRNMPISDGVGTMPDGYIGRSPITLSREAIGIALASDEYAARYFSNNASVGLALQFNDKISDNLREYLDGKLAEFGKLENKFKSLIMDQGGKIEKIGMSNEDSQFIESRNFSVEEIARIFRVPPVLIGHPTNTMTYASAEQLFLSFATYTIRPWCVRLEQSMNRNLLNERERGQYFFEFKMDGLLRGDLAARCAAYAQARQWGWLNVDEIRSLENMNPLPDGKGKLYLQPLNMTEPGKEPPKEGPIGSGQQGGDDA